MSSFYQISKFLEYKLNAVDRHSLQAPFIFNFYENVMKGKKRSGVFDKIERYRRELLKNETLITIEDFGAGSRVSKSAKRTVKDLARSGLSSRKFSEMLFRLSDYMESVDIVELGTSLGINTLYLAKSSPKARVTTFEGCRESAQIAIDLFKRAHQFNIEVIRGNIDLTLPGFAKKTNKVDLVYFDANHQFDATLRYYSQFLPLIHADTVFVIDDIYWSKSMGKAWKELVQQPEVTLSIDIFDAGLLFFNKDFYKEHYVLAF